MKVLHKFIKPMYSDVVLSHLLIFEILLKLVLIFSKHELGVLKDIHHVLFLTHFNHTLILHFIHELHNVLYLCFDLGFLPVVLHAF